MPLCLRPYLSVSLSHVSPSQSLSPSLLSCLSLTPPSLSRLFLARYPLNLYLSPFTASLSLSHLPLPSPIPLPPLSPLSRSVSHSLPLHRSSSCPVLCPSVSLHVPLRLWLLLTLSRVASKNSKKNRKADRRRKKEERRRDPSLGIVDPSSVQRDGEGYQYGDGVSPPSINAERYLHRCTPQPKQ